MVIGNTGGTRKPRKNNSAEPEYIRITRYENGISRYIYCRRCNTRIDTKGKRKIKCPECRTKNKVK